MHYTTHPQIPATILVLARQELVRAEHRRGIVDALYDLFGKRQNAQ